MKIILIVLDSLGVGALEDAERFGDSLECNTLSHVLESLPNKTTLKHLDRLDLLQLSMPNPVAKHAITMRLKEASNGKDTVVGHWEICGVISKQAFPTYPNGFPPHIITLIEQYSGRKVIGNKMASGTAIIEELGSDHLQRGDLIVYTSSDSVLQIAAHEEVMPVEELYQLCQYLRNNLSTGNDCVNRIIARPFLGNSNDGYKRTENRRDFTVPVPEGNMLTALLDKQIPVIAIGKIADIFPNVSFTRKFKTKNNQDGIRKTIEASKMYSNGLIFTNLVDFDMKFGHRRDAKGYAQALKEFNDFIPDIISTLNHDDWLMLTADHGCDPFAKGSDHTRELIPLTCWSPSLKQGRYLGEREQFSDISATITDLFGINLKLNRGNSFRKALQNER